MREKLLWVFLFNKYFYSSWGGEVSLINNLNKKKNRIDEGPAIYAEPAEVYSSNDNKAPAGNQECEQDIPRDRGT